MSAQYGKVVSLIVLERFGPVIEKVVNFLFKYGTNSLLHIKRGVELPLSKVKEALCILIKYRLVTFKPNRSEILANYTLQCDRVLLMLRYPKYINLIKKRFGEDAEMLVEELLQKGYSTASELVLQVFKRIQYDKKQIASLPKIRDELFTLINAKYIFRLPYRTEEAAVPILKLDEKDESALPPVDVKILSARLAGNAVEIPDNEIYWCPNFDRFHQDLRDKIIVDAFAKKFDDNAAAFVSALLEQMYVRTEPWAECSNPVPLLEIKNTIKKNNTHATLVAFFDQYATVLEQDSSNLIRKAGDAGGGSFQIHMKEIFIQLAWETVEQIVLEKFDTKAARIFRLVKTKRYVEPDQIQQLAMIPAKEAKRLSYQLLEENFFEVQELKKAASSSGPTKSFTLFYIQLDQVVRMVLELCYKTLFNLMTRRNYDRQVNKRIIDKKERVDTIALGMRMQGADEEQLADIEEMITPPEREILERIERTMKKLITLEFETDDTIFLLQLFLMYHNK